MRKIPGIARKEDKGDLSKLNPGDMATFLVQKHHALRRGLHRDVRLGNKETGLFSWATPMGMQESPMPKEKYPKTLIRTALHDYWYKDFNKSIPPGTYGAGTVSKEMEEPALITYKGKQINSFSLIGKHNPERYNLIHFGDKSVFNKSPHPTKPDIENPKFTKIKATKVEAFIKNHPHLLAQIKRDGALNLVTFDKRRIELLSHRISKRTGLPIVHTERVFGGRPKDERFDELKGNTLLGEVYALKKGKPLPPQEIAGLLNSNINTSLDCQKKNNIDFKVMLFDVINKSLKDSPYKDRLDNLTKLRNEYLDKNKFTLPETVTSNKDILKLWHKIQSGKHPETKEGLILHDQDTGKAYKAKTEDEHNIYIRGIFDADKGTKYEGKAVGGFTYSHTPNGKIVGKVGTGINDSLRKLMFKQPDSFIGRKASVVAQEKYPSGAFRMPVLHNIEEV